MIQRVLISGINGKLGSAIAKSLAKDYIIEGHYRSECLEQSIQNGFDLIIDATSALTIHEHMAIYLKHQVPVIIATSGIWPSAAEDYIKQANFPLIIAPNLSKSFRQFVTTAQTLQQNMTVKTIIETHHHHKKDSPSGSSLFLSHRLNNAPIQSLRVNKYIAKHEIIFTSGDDIIKLTHESNSPGAFIPGLIEAIEEITTINKGCLFLT